MLYTRIRVLNIALESALVFQNAPSMSTSTIHKITHVRIQAIMLEIFMSLVLSTY